MNTRFDQKIIETIEGWKNLQEENLVLIRGVIEGKPEKISTRYNTYYRVMVEVERRSGKMDYLPVMILERLVQRNVLLAGKQIEIEGEYRSRKVYGTDGWKHLDLFIFANQILTWEGGERIDQNVIVLEGYTRKTTSLRVTPLGRNISDIMLATKKNNQIPCIAWGNKAKEIEGKPAGTCIKLYGRVQSREYIKRYDDPQKNDETKVAYEVSIADMVLK